MDLTLERHSFHKHSLIHIRGFGGFVKGVYSELYCDLNLRQQNLSLLEYVENTYIGSNVYNNKYSLLVQDYKVDATIVEQFGYLVKDW